MPITIQHSASPSLIGTIAYEGGRGQALQREAARADEYAFRQNQAAMEMAFREQEALRQRQHAQESMALNAQLQQDAMAQAQKNRLETMAAEYSLKDQYEKDQLSQKRSSYLQKKQMIEEAYSGGNGQISLPQYEIAMKTLQQQYAGRPGDIDITDPFFSKITEADSPMWTAPDGTKIPLKPEEQAAWKAHQEYSSRQQQNEVKAKGDRLKAVNDLAKDRADLIASLMKITTGIDNEPIYDFDSAKAKAMEVYPDLPSEQPEIAPGPELDMRNLPEGGLTIPMGDGPTAPLDMAAMAGQQPQQPPAEAVKQMKMQAVQILGSKAPGDAAARIEMKKQLAALAANGDDEARQILVDAIKGRISK